MEGCGQGPLGKNWGDGIATDPQIIKSRGLSDPNPFFQALLQRPYIDQIIIGPHVYPPSISQAAEETQAIHPIALAQLIVLIEGEPEHDQQ